MKWYTIASSVLAAAQLLTPAVATATCKTTYASTTTKSVPTSTVTKTSTLRKTKTTYATSTSTVINTTTFTKTSASTTVTVPTSDGFTPIISASSIPTSSSKGRRAAVRERKAQRNGINARPREAAGAQTSSCKSSSTSKSYPHNVGCTTTITRTQTTTTTSTFVIGQFTGVTKTTTTHVPTATAYAACGHDNIISYFHGHALGDYAADHALGICGTSASGAQACISAESCCAAAQRSGYSGFQFTNYTGASNTCTILAGGVIPNNNGHWAFYSGNGGDHTWFGNGAYNGGIFAGAHTE